MSKPSTPNKTEPKPPAAKQGNGLAPAHREASGSPNSIVLTNEFGSTTVAEEVVAALAGLAIREVDGVRELVPFGTTQRLSSLASNIAGRDMRDLGVHVRMGTIECAVSCRVVVDYGVSIPRVADLIRKNVVGRVEQGTGLIVKRVDIDVVDLYFDEDHQRPVSTNEGVVELQ